MDPPDTAPQAHSALLKRKVQSAMLVGLIVILVFPPVCLIELRDSLGLERTDQVLESAVVWLAFEAMADHAAGACAREGGA